jgi:hypothetical protein
VSRVDRIRAALHAAVLDQGHGADVVWRLCVACVELLAVDGASVSVMTDTDNRQIVHATDAVIAYIGAVQFTLGEGPCFEAFHTRRSVLVPDLATTATPGVAAVRGGDDWPVGGGDRRVSLAERRDHYRCDGSLPPRTGLAHPEQVALALDAVGVATVALLAVQAGAEGETSWGELPLHRGQVHQATGRLIAALGVPAARALARLRGYALATGRLVDEVAGDVVAAACPRTTLTGRLVVRSYPHSETTGASE